MIPDGWEQKSLNEIVFINPRKPVKPMDGLVSFIPMDAVSEDARLLRLEEKQYECVEKGFTSFKDDDVLIAKITPCFENGKGAIASGLKSGIGFGSTEFHVLRAKSNICPKFIYYLTVTQEFRIRGEMNMQGSAGQKRVTTDYLKALKVLLPPFPEQKKIAKILSTWDKAINTTQALINASKQQKKALMQQLLTGKKRFSEFEGKWEEVKLLSLACPLRRKSFTDGDWIESPYISDSGCRLIQTGNIGIGTFKDKNKKYISEQSFIDLKCTEVQVGDLLICRLAEPAGRACVVPEIKENKMLTSVDVTIMKVDLSKTTAQLLSLFFSLDHTLYTVSSLCGGSTRSRISRTNLGAMKIKLPPLKEQQKIVVVLTNADQEIELLEQQLTDLKQEKKALMQQLLTGKRRVVLDKKVTSNKESSHAN